MTRVESRCHTWICAALRRQSKTIFLMAVLSASGFFCWTGVAQVSRGAEATQPVSQPSGSSPVSAAPQQRRAWTEAEASANGAPRAVDIEIIGHDAEGAYVSHGAGSILHEDGYILTCEHITADGDRQEVILADGTAYPFTILARAGGTFDTAILRIKPKAALPAVALGHSNAMAVGEKIMVIGNPDGKRHAVKYGVVEKTTCGGGTQIHVAKADVGPGDSGGPVFNMFGQQVALVHVKIFTLPLASRHIRVDHIRDAFATSLMDKARGKYEIGLDVDCQADGAIVKSVAKDSPAEGAGIRVGDEITRFDAMDIRCGPHYVLALLDRVTDQPIALALKRGEQAIIASVKPRARAK